jgi:ribose transport system substrate-binding protein
MNPLRAAAWAALALVFAALPACAGSGKTKVAFVTNNPDPFWSICEAGAQKAAAESDVELIFQRPENGTVGDQKQIMDGFLARGVKGISVSIIDPRSQRPYIEELASKIPLICVDNDIEQKEGETTKRLCYLGTDNIAAGRSAGELVEKAMPQGGTIVFFVGQIEPVNARERRQGVVDYLAEVEKKKPGVKYVEKGNGPSNQPFLDGADRSKAKENAENVLIDPRMKEDANLCLIGLWASNPPAIYSAVKAHKQEGKVKVVGFDENPDTLAGIRAGHIQGTIVQDPYNFGFESVKLMAALAKGDRSGVPANGRRFVPHRIITSENVDAFEADLNKKTGKK